MRQYFQDLSFFGPPGGSRSGIAFLLILILGFRAVDHSVIADAKPQPNFIIIFVDDLGYADVEPFGDRYDTPNLRRMADQGRSFTSFYVASSVCTPSRAALMTGCYPIRVDMFTNDLEMDSRNHAVLWPGDRKGLNPKEITIAEILKNRGYATACVGKWHLGDQPPFLPSRQGFDEYYGIPFSNDMGNSKPFFAPLPLVRQEKVLRELAPEDQNELTKLYTEYSLEFIERNSKRPFFLYLPHSMVHSPHHVSSRFRGSTGKGIYADVVAEIDWSVGKILDQLRALEIDKRTLVLFTSDNGGPYFFGKGASNYSSNYPYSGGKVSAAEGGFRVPTIAWWPGTIPAGTTCGLMASTIDILPTFAALSGRPFVPEPNCPIDGYDLSTFFQGEPPASSPRTTFAYYTDNTDPKKPRRPGRLSAIRSGRWKYYRTVQRFRLAGKDKNTMVPAGALFDLETDVSESQNVASEHPEVVKRLSALADELVRELGEGGHRGPGIRRAGFVDDARPLNLRETP